MPPILPTDLEYDKRYVVLTNKSITIGLFISLVDDWGETKAQFMRGYPEPGTAKKISNRLGFLPKRILFTVPIDSTRFFNVDDPDIPPIQQPPPARRPLPLNTVTAPSFVSLVPPPAPPPPPPSPPASPWEVPPTGQASWSPPPTPLPQGAPAAQQAPTNNGEELIKEATNAYKNPYGGRRSYFRLKKRKTKSRKTKKSKKTIKRRR